MTYFYENLIQSNYIKIKIWDYSVSLIFLNNLSLNHKTYKLPSLWMIQPCKTSDKSGYPWFIKLSRIISLYVCNRPWTKISYAVISCDWKYHPVKKTMTFRYLKNLQWKNILFLWTTKQVFKFISSIDKILINTFKILITIHSPCSKLPGRNAD